MPELAERALRIAYEAHGDQKRKGDGTPYILHPVAVSLKLASAGFSEQVVAAALVHDVLEDTDYPVDKLTQALGREVVEIVQSVTNDDSLPWAEKKMQYVESVENGPQEAKAVCIADKIHNLRSLLEAYEAQGEDLWKKFNCDKAGKLWFEGMVLTMLRKTFQHAMVDEYAGLIERLENIGDGVASRCHLWNQKEFSANEELPLNPLESIVDASHYNLFTCRCKQCGQKYLGYHTEVSIGGDDDCWNYWVPIDDEKIIAIKQDPEKAIEFIESRRRIVWHPDGPVYWNVGFEIAL